MTDDLETRRRRAAWRAGHRGTKELDLLIGRYAEARMGHMNEGELERFERFLGLQEPQLQSWLLAPEPPEAVAFADLVAEIRAFHGLDKA